MKYYSEITNKKYDSKDECEKAELEFNIKKEQAEADRLKKTEARKNAAKKVEDARDALVEARKNYNDVLSDFLKKYGSYHTTINEKMVDDMPSLFDLMDRLFF